MPRLSKEKWWDNRQVADHIGPVEPLAVHAYPAFTLADMTDAGKDSAIWKIPDHCEFLKPTEGVSFSYVTEM